MNTFDKEFQKDLQLIFIKKKIVRVIKITLLKLLLGILIFFIYLLIIV